MRIFFAGPLGYGYCLMVDDYPPHDSGSMCNDYRRMPVWDAPMVASLLAARQSTADLSVFGNAQGSGPQAAELRNTLASRGLQIHELGPEPKPGRVQLDVIIDSRRSASRTWYSTIDLPSAEVVFSAIRSSARLHPPDIVYADHWVDMGQVGPILAAVRPNLLMVYNAGDCADLDGWMILACERPARPIVVQISYKGDLPESAIVKRLGELPQLTIECLIITRGADATIVRSRSGVDVIPVPPVNVARCTVGAGSFVSANLIQLAMQSADWNWPNMVQLACEETSVALEADQVLNGVKF